MTEGMLAVCLFGGLCLLVVVAYFVADEVYRAGVRAGGSAVAYKTAAPPQVVQYPSDSMTDDRRAELVAILGKHTGGQVIALPRDDREAVNLGPEAGCVSVPDGWAFDGVSSWTVFDAGRTPVGRRYSVRFTRTIPKPVEEPARA